MNKIVIPVSGKSINKQSNLFLIIGGVLCLVILFFLVYVSSSTNILSCTLNEESMGMTMESKIDVKFHSNKFQNLNMQMVLDFGDYFDSLDEIVEEFKKNGEEVDSGVEYAVKQDGSKVIVTMYGDRKSLIGDKKYDLSKNDYKEVKESYEKEGYVCKEK